MRGWLGRSVSLGAQLPRSCSAIRRTGSGEMNTAIELPHRIVEAGLPPVQIIDMRDELKAGQRGIFSRLLLKELESTLGRGEQAILFLNRRGTATYIFCRDCGHVLRCPNCDTPLDLCMSKEKAATLLLSSLRLRAWQAECLSSVREQTNSRIWFGQ